MYRTKKLLPILSILLILAMLVGACATPAPSAPAGEQAAPEGAAASAATVNPKGEFPIVNEPETLKILIRAANGVSDYEDNAYTQWLEEQTGLQLDFDVAPNNDQEAKQKLNLVLASGELPDVIIGFGVSLADQQVLADQGMIIPVDDLIAEYGDEFAKVMEEVPQIAEITTLQDGKMYSLPDINECYHCTLAQKAWIYQPWLDALGLEVPTTTDELHAVLKAFKEQDPNGNGIADEIPWSAAVVSGWNSQIERFIMHSFILNSWQSSDTSRLYLEDGKIHAAYAEEGWKKGLEYLAQLYSEGLIDPQAFTNDSTQLKALAENPDTPILGFVQEGWPGMFLDWGGASGRWTEYVPIAPLKGPDGVQVMPQSPYSLIGTGRYLITKNAKNPAAAFRLADLMYNYEATLRNALGRPEQEWVWSEPGAEGIDGGEAKYKVIAIYTESEQNFSWNQAAPGFRSAAFRLAQEYNPEDPLERLLYNWSRDLYQPYAQPDMQVPPLTFTSEQSQRLGELRTALTTLVDQSFAGFVTGQLSIEDGWEQYLSELENNNLSEFLSIYQAAYDAKFK